MADIYRHASSVAIFLSEERATQHFLGLWDLIGMLKGVVERVGAKPLWYHEDIGAALDEIKLNPKTEEASLDEGIFRLHESHL